MPFSARVMLVMWLGFILYVFLNLSTPEEMVRYVSWNEFIHDILAKGEVSRLNLSYPCHYCSDNVLYMCQPVSFVAIHNRRV